MQILGRRGAIGRAAAGAATGRPDAVRTDLAIQLSPEAKDADFGAMIVANPETTLRAVG
jgi:hypothetical protein